MADRAELVVPDRLPAAALKASCGWPKGSESAAVASVTIARFLAALLADDGAMDRACRASQMAEGPWFRKQMRAALIAAAQEPNG